MSDNTLAIRETALGEPLPESAGARKNPLLMIHRLLRGRYRYAVPLAILLAIPMGIAGFFALPPTYESTGTVRVIPKLPQIMPGELPEAAVPPLFDSFVATQSALLGGSRVIEAAAGSDALRKAGWPAGDAGILALREAISVRSPKNSQIIVVTVSHAQPNLAKEAVNAVLTSYETIYGTGEGIQVTTLERKLRDLEMELRNDLAAARKRVKDISVAFGTFELQKIHEANVEAMLKLQSTIGDLDLQIAGIEARMAQDPAATASAEGAPVSAGIVAPTAIELAAIDRELEQLLTQESAIKQQLNAAATRLGPNHRDILDMKRTLESKKGQIADRVAMLLARPSGAGSVASVPGGGQSLSAVNIAQLKALREQYLTQLQSKQGAVSQLGTAIDDIDRAQDEANDIKERLDQVTTRLAQIDVERDSLATGRVIVAERGNMPLAPAKDRRIGLAVAGAGFGAALGLGLFVLGGLVQGTYRYVEELEGADLPAPFLGALPELDAGDPDHDAQAALSVHHLRNLLRLQGGRRADGFGTVYTITSPTQGDGKTSLSLALGMSFAVSGYRTILVDADLVGRGLSRRMGYGDEAGLCEAVEAGSVNGELIQTGFRNLWALPPGRRDRIRPENLSQVNLRVLVEQLRGLADAIIIDTGPLLGSLEANLLAGVSDRVVLTISRGQKSRLLRVSLRRLQSLGAQCAGVVLNRADRRDVERSSSSLSVSRQSLPAEAPPPPRKPGNRPPPPTGGTDRHSVVRAILGKLDRETEDRAAS